MIACSSSRYIQKERVNFGSANMMDHVLDMLEKQAEVLEVQVVEQTKVLIEEKKKSDILLYRMMPKLVACYSTYHANQGFLYVNRTQILLVVSRMRRNFAVYLALVACEFRFMTTIVEKPMR